MVERSTVPPFHHEQPFGHPPSVNSGPHDDPRHPAATVAVPHLPADRHHVRPPRRTADLSRHLAAPPNPNDTRQRPPETAMTRPPL